MIISFIQYLVAKTKQNLWIIQGSYCIYFSLLDFVAVIKVDLLKRQMPHHGERKVQNAAAGDKTWQDYYAFMF